MKRLALKGYSSFLSVALVQHLTYSQPAVGSILHSRRHMAQDPKANEEKSDDKAVTFLSGKDAAQLDVDLMENNGDYQFVLQQLMEMAGLSVACSIMDAYTNQHLPNSDQCEPILILCGPGNNGGDGLVAARHLKLFGIYEPVVYYPTMDNPKQEFYKNLLQQLDAFNIKVIKEFPSEKELSSYKLIVDAVFGFSFKGPLRGSWKERFPLINEISAKNDIPIVAVDVPSGWNVDEGPHVDDICLNVSILVSLSAPKHCAKQFKGIHYLGGRFLPQKICQKYNLALPAYPGAAQCVRIDSNL